MTGGDGEAAQAQVLAFLGAPESHGLAAGERVEQVTTHAAHVFLAGRRAIKIKRAVRYSFLDFSTRERRRAALAAELELNRRTAPEIYRRLLPVTWTADGALALGGAGEVAEWALEMRRFEQSRLFDRLAAEGALAPPEIEALVDVVHAFHEEAAVLGPPFGGADALAQLIADNEADLAGQPARFAPARVAALTAASRTALAGVAGLLDRRRAAGWVRRCHGDLHLGNIVLWQGRPTPFDCIEFDESLAASDVVYDLAFLLMDLDVRASRALANLAMSRYLGRAGQVEVLAALPLMLSLRAAIRAKVSAMAVAAQDSRQAAESLAARAAALFAAAEGYLAPQPARLLAIGGLSGTGKSTLGRALAPGLGRAPGALHLRSDVLRKRLFGRAPEARLPAEAYTPAVNEKVYATLFEEARQALAAGQAVVADALWARPDERARLAALAREAGVAFTGLWLEAPPEVLRRRVAGRRGDASDATPEVLERQLGYDPGEIDWQRLDVAAGPQAVAERARALLGPGESGARTFEPGE